MFRFIIYLFTTRSKRGNLPCVPGLGWVPIDTLGERDMGLMTPRPSRSIIDLTPFLQVLPMVHGLLHDKRHYDSRLGIFLIKPLKSRNSKEKLKTWVFTSVFYLYLREELHNLNMIPTVNRDKICFEP